VDTHKDTHVAAVITAVGVVVASQPFPATAAGYRQLLGWARGFSVLRRAGVEGTGCYGAALTRFLRADDVEVVEVNRPDRAARRRRGKSDAVDAEAAARAVLAGHAVVTPIRGRADRSPADAQTWPATPRSRHTPRRSTNSGPCS
jgi:transposase